MSERGSTARGGGSSKQMDRGKSTDPSKTPLTLVPHPSYPGLKIPAYSSNLQVLGQIPKPYSSALASQPVEIDPFSGPSKSSDQSLPKKRSDYFPSYETNLFHIEPSMKPKNDPINLASQYFPEGYHFAPPAYYKSVSWYKDVLIQTESVHIKPIYDRNDSKKVMFHSLYIKKLISPSEWQNHPSYLIKITDPSIPMSNDNCYFNFYDYLEAWNKIFLYQNKTFSHSWFIQFDHKFKSQIPFWFTTWWSRFGPSSSIFPESLLAQVTYFSCKAKPSPKFEGIPLLLQFVSKYKIPWILRWQYTIHTPVTETSSQSASHPEVRISNYSPIPVVARIFFVKWWDKFDVQRIIGQVQAEFPPAPVKPLASSSGVKKEKSRSSPESSLHLSDLKEYSITELKLLTDAIKQRHSEISKEIEEEASSSSSSQASVSSKDPYCSQYFQDAQDPYA